MLYATQDDAYIHMQKIVISSGVHQGKISALDLEMDTATVDKKISSNH